MTDGGTGHGFEDARIDVRGAGAHEHPFRRVETVCHCSGLLLLLAEATQYKRRGLSWPTTARSLTV
ncbi:hypothetical protein Thpro_020737 [Acidihalobacter prosperus]|uniref:Uncharacterized protein n=1 Tax=Acidihalobacter prosperus TaxID=160660 RepID=A0A1A6C8Y2_9GAMM|nr:hypothetical protein Thpro_020737 [Acidihalobacter prosperus]